MLVKCRQALVFVSFDLTFSRLFTEPQIFHNHPKILLALISKCYLSSERAIKTIGTQGVVHTVFINLCSHLVNVYMYLIKSDDVLGRQ